MTAVHIIGAGPAGLIAAERLSQAGCDVHVYDRKASPARKFLMAGRGGLNLTHSEDLEMLLNHYGDARSFLEPFVRAFPPSALQQWCEDLGESTFTGSSGRIFPKSMKASPLLRAWLARLNRQGVQFHMNHTWNGWNDAGDLVFTNKDGSTDTVRADVTLLALGGASWPSLGSDGTWQSILNQKRIHIHAFKPANCGFRVEWSDFIRSRFAGQPLKPVGLRMGDQSIQGEVMIDANGIEGGAIYALSRCLRDGIAKNGYAELFVDLRPTMSMGDIEKKLIRPRGRMSFSSWLPKAMNLSPLAIALLHESNKDASALSPKELASLIKSCSITLTAPFPIERAISSAGGIDLSEVDGNMMIKQRPGLFVAGEMLDWEAPTGGYLLQACFSTGMAAGEGILAYKRGK